LHIYYSDKMEDKITIELTELEANSFILFQKYYPEFIRLQQQGIFNKEFTGQVILDILQGEIKNLKKVLSIHYEFRI
jgi:hypothetical protein